MNICGVRWLSLRGEEINLRLRSSEPANDRDSKVCVGEQACSHAGFGTRLSRNLRTLSTNSAGFSFRASSHARTAAAR
jgi:hypothetical protein